MTRPKAKKTSNGTPEQRKKYYSCKSCNYKTTYKSSYTRHLSIHKKHISCSVCQFKCSTQGRLKNHMLVHSGKRYYECYYCDYVNRLECMLKIHISRRHPDVKLFKCKFCDFKAVDECKIEKHSLKKHIESGSGTMLVNEVNKDDSNYMPAGNRKSDLKYPSVVLTRCDDQTVNNSTQVDLPIKPERIADMLLKQYTFMSEPGCDSMESNAPQDIVLNEHNEANPPVYKKALQLKGGFEMIASIFSESQNGGNNKISRCEITFRKADVMLKHDEEQRKSDSFKCTLCDFTSKFHKCLIRHNKKHHKSKSLPCGKCTFSRKNIRDLKKHVTSHEGTGVYNCDSCHHSAPCKSMFDTHKFIHSGQTKYKCKQCGFKSATSHGIRRHSRVHSALE